MDTTTRLYRYDTWTTYNCLWSAAQKWCHFPISRFLGEVSFFSFYLKKKKVNGWHFYSEHMLRPLQRFQQNVQLMYSTVHWSLILWSTSSALVLNGCKWFLSLWFNMRVYWRMVQTLVRKWMKRYSMGKGFTSHTKFKWLQLYTAVKHKVSLSTVCFLFLSTTKFIHLFIKLVAWESLHESALCLKKVKIIQTVTWKRHAVVIQELNTTVFNERSSQSKII